MSKMKQHGPWGILSSKKVFENPWVKVSEDKVIRPDGKPGSHVVIEINEGSHVLAVDEFGYCYLTREFHYAIGREGIENAAGGIDKGESPLQAAKRELTEELGITARKWTSLGKLEPLTTLIKARQHLFLAQELSFGKRALEGTEKITLVKMHFSKLYEKCASGEITYSALNTLALRAKGKL